MLNAVQKERRYGDRLPVNAKSEEGYRLLNFSETGMLIKAPARLCMQSEDICIHLPIPALGKTVSLAGRIKWWSIGGDGTGNHLCGIEFYTDNEEQNAIVNAIMHNLNQQLAIRENLAKVHEILDDMTRRKLIH